MKRTHAYDDIINCPRPDQSERGKLKEKDRAAQFCGFKALNSSDERLDEAARILFGSENSDNPENKKSEKPPHKGE